MIFTTETGSRYEIDVPNTSIRRLSGNKPATNRQGPDGEWREYTEFFPSPVEVGKQLVIAWNQKATPMLDATTVGIPITITSRVVSIEN